MEEGTNKNNRNFLILHIGAIALMTGVIILLIIPNESGKSYFAVGVTLVAALSFGYGATARYLKPKPEGKTAIGNPYHKFFFRGTAVLTMILTILGIIGAFFVYVEHDNLFQAVGLVTSVIWIGAFLMYFMWAVYHYNINYGLTDQDWEKIFEAEERYRQGFPVKPSELESPHANPYRSQTFGLPPGTVRGMIAFTLLIGGMSLLIVSFGTQYTGAELALVRQQFEFFETAFLMMIAFYFGDKSLRYLKDRWTDPNKKTKDGSQGPNHPLSQEFDNFNGPDTDPSSDEPRDQVYDENQDLLNEEIDYSQVNDTRAPSSTRTPKQSKLRNSFINTAPNPQQIEYVQIMDNLHYQVLSDEAIKDALDELKTKENISLSLPVVKAVVEIESAGRGHFRNGKAKILFEGHKFWYWLDQFGKKPQDLQKGNENILYKSWTKEKYLTGTDEYKRLEQAKKIDEKAAIYATSWGLFQILGENMEHFIKGRNYKDVHEFEQKQHESEYVHFLDFLEFIKTKKVRGKPLINYISEDNNGNYDWETFAYGYNGSGYKVNQYDINLKKAYQKFKKEDRSLSGWIPVIDAGHGGLVDGRYVTAGKQYQFTDGTVIYEGVINRSIGRMLASMLKTAGIPYLQTTLETEADIGLNERVQLTNSLYQANPSCYLLSIHSNAASNDIQGEGNLAKGFEIYTSIGQTKSDELANIASKWYKKLFPDFSFRQTKTEGGQYQNKEAAYVVLTKTKCPAFLVENLFYDNKNEATFLSSTEGQRRIAACLFEIVKEIYQKG